MANHEYMKVRAAAQRALLVRQRREHLARTMCQFFEWFQTRCFSYRPLLLVSTFFPCVCIFLSRRTRFYQRRHRRSRRSWMTSPRNIQHPLLSFTIISLLCCDAFLVFLALQASSYQRRHRRKQAELDDVAAERAVLRIELAEAQKKVRNETHHVGLSRLK